MPTGASTRMKHGAVLREASPRRPHTVGIRGMQCPEGAQTERRHSRADTPHIEQRRQHSLPVQ